MTRRCATAAMAVIAVAPLSCAADDVGPRHTDSASSTTAAPASTRPASPEAALRRAIAYQATVFEQIDAASLGVVDYLARNWQVSELAGARDVALRRSQVGTLTVDERLLRRLIDPTAPPPGLDAMAAASPTTQVLAAALHCDPATPDRNLVSRIRSLGDQGGYSATHAAWALQWLAELGCGSPGVDSARAELVDRVAQELARATDVDDLALERSATLVYLGAAERLPRDWIDRVIAEQLGDGGWGQKTDDTASSWHATALAVWTLLGVSQRGEGATMVPLGP